jgi:hypothetical protein
MHKILKRFESGAATMADLDLLLEVANNIEGNTICALGDAAAWPVQSMIRRFPEEFAKKLASSALQRDGARGATESASATGAPDRKGTAATTASSLTPAHS